MYARTQKIVYVKNQGVEYYFSEDGKLLFQNPQNMPTYHDILSMLCSIFNIPGSPSLVEAINYIKDKLGDI